METPETILPRARARIPIQSHRSAKIQKRVICGRKTKANGGADQVRENEYFDVGGSRISTMEMLQEQDLAVDGENSRKEMGVDAETSEDWV